MAEDNEELCFDCSNYAVSVLQALAKIQWFISPECPEFKALLGVVCPSMTPPHERDLG